MVALEISPGLGALGISFRSEGIYGEEAGFLISVVLLVLVPERLDFLFTGVCLGAEGALFQEGGVDRDLLVFRFRHGLGKIGFHGSAAGDDILNAHQAHGVSHQAAQDFFLELLALVAAHGNEIVVLLGIEHALVIQEFRNVADGFVNLRIAGGEAQAFRLPADVPRKQEAALGYWSSSGSRYPKSCSVAKCSEQGSELEKNE